MFDFSLGKLLLLALIALLVLGPDKLPGAARSAGTMLRRLRAAWDNVRADLERELEVEEIRRAAHKAAADAEAAQSEASETLNHLRAEVEKARVEAARLNVGETVDETATETTQDSAPKPPASRLSHARDSEPHHGQD